MKQKYFLLFMSCALIGVFCKGMIVEDPESYGNNAEDHGYKRWEGFNDDVYVPLEDSVEDSDSDIELIPLRTTNNGIIMKPITYDLTEESDFSDDDEDDESSLLQQLGGYFQCMKDYLTCGFLKQEKPPVNLASLLGRVVDIRFIEAHADGTTIYKVITKSGEQTPYYPPITKKRE